MRIAYLIAMAALAGGMVVQGPAQAEMVAPAAGYHSVAFSPDGGAVDLVIKAIASAKRSIRAAAYSFTSKPIAVALLDARRRGVDVRLVVDEERSLERYSATTFLANSGVAIRTDGRHGSQHNKYLVIDERTVQTGSFNYSAAAADRNAENAVVLWDSPRIAQSYLDDWALHWAHGVDVRGRY